MTLVDQKQEIPEQDSRAEVHIRHKFGYMQFFALFILGIFLLWSPKTQNARAYLTSRSVAINSSLPSAVTYYDFTFDALGSPAIASVAFEFCSNSPLIEVPCVAPAGFDSSAVNLLFQSGDVGYSVHPNTSSSPNRVVLTRAVSASIAGTKQYRIGNITNPSSPGVTTYVRLFTYGTNDGTGPHDDTGSIAFSTQNPLSVSVYVPPFIIMCSGVTIAADCSSANGEVVDMGELSKTSANSATTQFAVATNSFTGYSAVIVGSTMTAGNRTIPALSVPSVSQPGVGQFGINLRQNTIPSVGANVDGVGGGGSVAGGYNVANVFRFQSGDTIASSPISTEFNRYTISYLVNVPDGQPAGRYASTLTVIATTTF